MTTCTPTYGLVYAIGSDAPCDIGDTLCQFATAVDTLLQGFADTLGRLETIPLAKVSVDNPASGLTPGIVYTDEEVDTDGMVDLTLDPRSITARRAGLFLLTSSLGSTVTPFPGGYPAVATSQSLVNGFQSVNQSDNFLSAGFDDSDGHDGQVTGNWTPLTIFKTNATWDAGDSTQLAFGGTSTLVIVAAETTMYWFSDL